MPKLKYYNSPQSSNIQGYCYDNTNQTLLVDFKGNRTYVYEVPPKTFVDFTKAESIGKFLATQIKDKFEVKEIDFDVRKQWSDKWVVVNPGKPNDN